MRKKTVVLCESTEHEDRLAVAVMHLGVCEECASGIVKLIGANGSANGHAKEVAKPRRGRPPKLANAKANGVMGGYAKRVHAKCGREIDPRGWRKHVDACKGKKG